MKTSHKGIDLIKKFEGCRLDAYLCPAKVWTIGFGHTYGVQEGTKITEHEAETLLIFDLIKFESFLNTFYLKVNQNQYDALISFIFNLGPGNFKKSTLLKKIKENPDDLTIGIEFNRWNKAGGKVLAGLTARRKAESELYFTE